MDTPPYLGRMDPQRCLGLYLKIERMIEKETEKLYGEKAYLDIITKNAFDRGHDGNPEILAAEAALTEAKSELDLAIARFSQVSKQENSEEYVRSLEQLEAVNTKVGEITAHVHSLIFQIRNLKKVEDLFEKLFQAIEENLSDFSKRCSSLRTADIEIRSMDDIANVVKLRKRIGWKGSIFLADGLSAAEREMLTSHISRSALAEFFELP